MICRSGVEEDYTEKDELLQEIFDLRAEFQAKKDREKKRLQIQALGTEARDSCLLKKQTPIPRISTSTITISTPTMTISKPTITSIRMLTSPQYVIKEKETQSLLLPITNCIRNTNNDTIITVTSAITTPTITTTSTITSTSNRVLTSPHLLREEASLPIGPMRNKNRRIRNSIQSLEQEVPTILSTVPTTSSYLSREEATDSSLLPTITRNRNCRIRDPTLHFMNERHRADIKFQQQQINLDKEKLQFEKDQYKLQAEKFMLEKEERMNKLEIEKEERMKRLEMEIEDRRNHTDTINMQRHLMEIMLQLLNKPT